MASGIIKLSRLFIRKIIWFILIIVLLSVTVDLRGAEDDSYKIRALRQTGKQLLEIGYEQYHRGMYAGARASFEKALRYKKYLSVSDSSKLETLLLRVNEAAGGDEAVIESPVVEQFPEIEQLPELELQTSAVEPQMPDITEEPYIIEEPGIIYTAPVATEVFIEQPSEVDTGYIEFVPAQAEDLAETEPTPYIELPADVITMEVPQPEFFTPVPELQPQGPVVDAKESYIDVIRQKQRIQQSYTKAVVNDAIAKAKELAGNGEFAAASDEFSRASGVVVRNKLLLGDSVYSDYSATLKQLREEISARQEQQQIQKAVAARTEAQAAQEKLRQQQSADREKRIESLMTHSSEYQQQQKYEEALGQLETLLAIDPTNREASRNRQMLEDILNLRRQLQVKKEMGREDENILYDTQKSMIPHADLITYPRNWQDIAAKRKAREVIGLSAADKAAYRQLETLVDLTALTPDTPFDEAIETIRSVVDPPLKLTVRWRDLEENAYIEPDTVIKMQGINGIPLGKGLKEVLDSVSGGITEIAYGVEDGIVTVATRESLPVKLVTRVYDITELVGTPAEFSTDLEAGGGSSRGGRGGGSSRGGSSRGGSSRGGSSRSGGSSRGGRGGGGGDMQISTTATRLQNAASIVQMIQDTIEPDSWLVNGGDGTISNHGNKLIINQTPQIHEQIQKLVMEDLRESLGQQVSLETRFLFVTENFLEDIGIDMSFDISPLGKLTRMTFKQGSYALSQPTQTLVPGSLAAKTALNPGISLVDGASYGSLMDDLMVTFLLRATQAHRDAKMLTAPRVTVLSGESAYIRVTKDVSYVSDYDFEDITSSGDNQPTRVIADPQTDVITGGVILNITPTITADKKYVILNISTSYTKIDIGESFDVHSGTTGEAYPIYLPTEEIAEVQTRVSIPDGGTLLIGGQKLGAEINRESGVPGLSKIPIIGRLFSNRSKVKDQDILLILVKPTIILQDESEREYFAPLE